MIPLVLNFSGCKLLRCSSPNIMAILALIKSGSIQKTVTEMPCSAHPLASFRHCSRSSLLAGRPSLDVARATLFAQIKHGKGSALKHLASTNALMYLWKPLPQGLPSTAIKSGLNCMIASIASSSCFSCKATCEAVGSLNPEPKPLTWSTRLPTKDSLKCSRCLIVSSTCTPSHESGSGAKLPSLSCVACVISAKSLNGTCTSFGYFAVGGYDDISRWWKIPPYSCRSASGAVSCCSASGAAPSAV
mmetsp:Transcript_151269/g.282045  ORF Transcript_151269/g.282045 Transcript_151269/m.282045 type:complete len:246 (+) Transcript_151269:291-1028(+)